MGTRPLVLCSKLLKSFSQNEAARRMTLSWKNSFFPYANEALDVPWERKRRTRDTKTSHRETIGVFLSSFHPQRRHLSRTRKRVFRSFIAKINEILLTHWWDYRTGRVVQLAAFWSLNWFAEKRNLSPHLIDAGQRAESFCTWLENFANKFHSANIFLYQLSFFFCLCTHFKSTRKVLSVCLLEISSVSTEQSFSLLLSQNALRKLFSQLFFCRLFSFTANWLWCKKFSLWLGFGFFNRNTNFFMVLSSWRSTRILTIASIVRGVFIIFLALDEEFPSQFSSFNRWFALWTCALRLNFAFPSHVDVLKDRRDAMGNVSDFSAMI